MNSAVWSGERGGLLQRAQPGEPVFPGDRCARLQSRTGEISAERTSSWAVPGDLPPRPTSRPALKTSTCCVFVWRQEEPRASKGVRSLHCPVTDLCEARLIFQPKIRSAERMPVQTSCLPRAGCERNLQLRKHCPSFQKHFGNSFYIKNVWMFSGFTLNELINKYF